VTRVTFLDAWSLPSLDLALLLLPAAVLAVPLVLPGARVVSLASLATAASLAVSPLLGAAPGLRAGWVALWVLIGLRLWRAPASPGGRAAPTAGFESAAIGLAVGGGLVAVMVFAVAKQDLPPAVTRRLCVGLVLLGLGLLHLMLRRHALRAAAGFAALALGVQLLDTAARAAQLPDTAPAGAATLVAAALVAALTFRLGESRRRFAGSPWVSDAHDLHD
jgi:hypothetical protein